ncbi:MAG: hypothetical protein JWP39_703 [Jatrophihabitans sp.]|nr:hypothetical protein [Jatrophihabitans sp.]
MTALVSAPVPPPVLSARRLPIPAWMLAPTAFAIVNAVAFFLLRPGVNDLWAARARASAVSHGVGLFYWFGWFGGGSTPGNYSVVTPYISSWIGTELVGALAAVAATVLCTVLVRGTAHPRGAAAVAAVAIAINLWSGRVPFLLGSAFAVGALIAVRRRQRTATVGLTLLSILASPVSGAFVVVGLSGTFLSTRTKAYRPIIAYAVGTAVLAIGGVALAFGTPGPEPFSFMLLIELVGALLLLLAARPPDHIRATIWVSVLASTVLFLVPNGMGSNFARFVWFCLPVAVIATGTARRWVVAVAALPLVISGMTGTITDLQNSGRPVSTVDYYTPLANRLDRIVGLENYRVEVVNHGAHAGYDALLTHASLARGWETQEDIALNKSLSQDPLSPVTYKVWLDNNAVGYVALPSSSVNKYPEYTLVAQHSAPYLTRIWSNADWELFRVSNPTPIVAHPAVLVGHTQSAMTIDIPCTCAVTVRVRWSKFLSATAPASGGPPSPAGTKAQPTVDAAVTNDGSGWTTITTIQPGYYFLRGSIGGLLR